MVFIPFFHLPLLLFEEFDRIIIEKFTNNLFNVLLTP